MSTASTGAGERLRRLVFQWPGRSVSLAFPLIFLAVIIAHALTFYGFQVIYPPVSSVAPPPGEVMLIMPDSPAHAKLLEWVDAQSPALAPRLQETAPEGLLAVRYQPSYADVRTLPKPAAPAPRSTVFPAAYSPLSLLAPAPAAKAITAQAVSTTLKLSGELAGRMPQAATLHLSERTDGSLLPAVFLIGVNDYGSVLYTFLQESSGSAAMDAQAESALRRQRFAPAPGGVAWGLATFAWGGEGEGEGGGE